MSGADNVACSRGDISAATFISILAYKELCSGLLNISSKPTRRLLICPSISFLLLFDSQIRAAVLQKGFKDYFGLQRIEALKVRF